MSAQHTPMPLQIVDSLVYRLTDEDGINADEIFVTMWNKSLNSEERAEGARRVLACLNAVSGVSTELLEKFTMAGIDNVIQQNAHLERQRDELLAALKDSLETLENENETLHGAIRDTIWHTEHETLFDFMGEAIAKAEASNAQKG